MMLLTCLVEDWGQSYFDESFLENINLYCLFIIKNFIENTTKENEAKSLELHGERNLIDTKKF